MTSIFEGIRILDCSIYMQGPSATVMLGDMGAEVIKLEPLTGDPSRGLVDIIEKTMDISITWDFIFEYLNRNKKSIAIDLKNPRGREIIYRMIKRCDIFVQNFRKGVAERLGIGYDELVKHNPKLIYATASGYGIDGPDSAEPSFDYMGQARSGFMNAVGGPDTPPTFIVGGVADQMGAIMLAYGIMAAVIARERLGIGQRVDISHLGSMMHLQGLNVQAGLNIGRSIPKYDREKAVNPLWNHYRCADGKWICLGMVEADRYWADFCAALGMPELADDPRFKDIAVRSDNAEQAVAILDERFAARPRDEWMKLLKEGGDFIYTVVNDIPDLKQDQQAIVNNYVVDFDHPVEGRVKVSGYPVQFSETPCAIQRRAPELGEHTRQLLEQIGGYSRGEIEELLVEGVAVSSGLAPQTAATQASKTAK
jgi:crotonobetainyl-CoA:carnitine CoA-transferase CaiB-like acyl-CoA transferase